MHESKPADFEGNPLPSGELHVTDFKVNGRGQLVAFAGGGAREITVDGNRTVFADAPVAEIGWAPVAEARRVPGGAVLQMMVRGAGTVRIPGSAANRYWWPRERRRAVAAPRFRSASKAAPCPSRSRRS